MATRIVTVLSDADLENLRSANAVRMELSTRIAQEIARRLAIHVEITLREDEDKEV